MIHIEIPKRKIKTQLPGTWEELTPEQFVILAGLIHRLISNEIDYDRFQILMLFGWLNIKTTGRRLNHS